MDIGPRIRAARKSLRISLRALAQRTGFSPSFLSQVELGQSSPSLASLQRICGGLDVDLTDLLRERAPRGAEPVVRRRTRESLRSEWSRASAESLLPSDADDRLTALLLCIDPGGRTGSIARRRGARDFAYCIRGRVEITLGDQRHALGPGDSVVVEEAAAACWTNLGTSRAEVLFVSALLL